jgi:hypothetical protein
MKDIMSSNTVGGKADLVTPDALSLPMGFVKPYSAPQPTTQKPQHDHGDFAETIITEIQKNGRERIRVTRSIATGWGGIFCIVRYWERGDDGEWRSSKRGINIRADFVEQVAAAMLEAIK